MQQVPALGIDGISPVDLTDESRSGGNGRPRSPLKKILALKHGSSYNYY